MMSINGVRVGAQLVMSAWLAVKFTGDGHAVGILFVGASTSAFVFARPIGKVISIAKSKKRMVWLGHAGMAIGALAPAVLLRATQ